VRWRMPNACPQFSIQHSPLGLDST
jgi:hypothetical protein